ncbi:MAG: UPF0104 family protein [Candidatus Scalindua sp. AMX11]|nr:MAG: UPF0104 family protein [Candidatus Scalindua sp.]NOG84129.1 flippase-like domain-containing protein [Planctomycetota bacterium]RZV98962.1 MAG: flippase-like domain-containing protein [Candidatus Scalindua sp. SCAELEC01]TDE66847.1 MAG: UPF0104 family protein [Candidatus Scalindua sp. AMX11]GJQ57646.1 MAG: hypothetical protein SCALA701_04470 [Candidatus Scalindua sp.]
MKMLIAGIIISLIFVYFTFKGVNFEDTLKGLGNANYTFLALALIIAIIPTLLRAMRLQIIVSPIKKTSLRKLFPITCIGFMAIVLFPLRTGELVRPYLLHQESKISLTSSLAIIFLERVFDSLILLCMLVIVILNSDVSSMITRSGYGLLVTLLILISIIVFIYFRTDMVLRLLMPLTDRCSKKWQLKIEKIVKNVADGFHIISRPKILFYTLFLSLLLWALTGLTIYALFYFLQLNLPLICAFTVLIITIVGVSVPAAPGFLGTFQFACIMALSLFNVPKENAVLFSMVYYLLGIGITILLGVIFLPFIDFSFKEGLKKLRIQSKAV